MPDTSRFSQVSRRAFLHGVSAAAVLGLAGCGTNDASVLPDADPSAAPTAGPTSAAPASPAPSSSAPTDSESPSTTSAPTVRELTVNFTYTVDTTATSGGGRGGGRGGGMTRKPYIAVWIEDSSGDLVKTVLLWHLQGERDRWLSELRRWSAASGDAETTSSATRSAGSYDVVWDLTDSSGNPVADGSYTLCIESSREHGPYSLVTADLPITGKRVDAELEPQGELTGGSLSYRP